MAKGKHTGHRLKGPGPGRPKGVPNKATHEMKEFARGVTLQDPKYVKSLTRRLRRGEAQQVEIAMLHYGYGKPPDKVKFEGEQPFKIIFESPPEAEQ